MRIKESKFPCFSIEKRLFPVVRANYIPKKGEILITEIKDTLQSYLLHPIKNNSCDVLCGCGDRTYNLGIDGIFCHKCLIKPEDLASPEFLMVYIAYSQKASNKLYGDNINRIYDQAIKV